MKSGGIWTSIYYPPIHHFSAYQELTENLAARAVTLPCYPALPAAEVTSVVEVVRDSMDDLN
ncbi:MAG: DegT/DnrJ/EryC1/StrS family aminotransferase [Chloroflexota bacterium]